MTQDESDIMAMMESELTPVVTVPAPGGELTILKSKRLPETERLVRAESMLHGMIEVTENAPENPRPGISNKLLPRPSQLAKGVSDVAKRLEYEMRHKEEIENQRAILENQRKTQQTIEDLEAAANAAVINSSKAKEAAEWLKNEEERKKRKRKKTGRESQRKGEKDGNGRKSDMMLKNQIMTEVRQVMKKNHCSQSTACQIVSMKHLQDDNKTPIFSKRTIENWMSKANSKKKP